MTSLIVAVFAASHPVPLLLACMIGFFPLWGSLALVRKANFLLLAPAVVLVMLAGMTVDKAHDQLADLFDMHPKPIQEQIDSARQYLKNHPTE
jgi:hypothetical protein